MNNSAFFRSGLTGLLLCGQSKLLAQQTGAPVREANGSAALASKTDSMLLADRLQTLERKIEELERRQAQPGTGSAVAGAGGFFLKSPDGAHQLRLRGLLQTDSRLVDGASISSATSFVMRRVRPIFEATAFQILDLRFVPDFGNGRAEVFDAHADLRFRPWFTVRSGKFKPPIGLERLQGAADLLFVERGIPTNLVPQRDIGVQFGGDVRSGILSWQLGVFNGAPDLSTADADNASQKDVAARLFVHPFKKTRTAFVGLGIGLAGSEGAQVGTTATPSLPAYRSASQQTVFSYRADGTAAGTALASGVRRRLSPQGYWYSGPFGMLAEYTRSSQEVVRGTTAASLTHVAWQLSTNYVVAGGSASYRSVTPTKAFGAGGSGALEVGARIGALELDAESFPVFANPDASVQRMQGVGVVVTWHIAAGVKILADLERTTFRGGAPASADRSTEQALLLRMQHAF